jgi:hypothetical protein
MVHPANVRPLGKPDYISAFGSCTRTENRQQIRRPTLVIREVATVEPDRQLLTNVRALPDAGSRCGVNGEAGSSARVR